MTIELCPLCMEEHEIDEQIETQEIDFDGVIMPVDYEFRVCPQDEECVYESEDQFKRNCQRYKLAEKEAKELMGEVQEDEEEQS